MNKVILGLSFERTVLGKDLSDGSACIFNHGKLLSAIAEERLNKIKYSGGSLEACNALLKMHNLNMSDVDSVVVSSCCEVERSIPSITGFDDNIVISCNHHISHALGAFSASGFNRSIVCVFDGGGNITSTDNSKEWWTVGREQHSYYIVDSKSIKKIEDDFNQPYDMGFGEVYRAFVKFIRLGAAENAGKMMALSAFGDHDFFSNSLFNISTDGKLSSEIKYTDQLGPYNVEKIIENYFKSYNIEINRSESFDNEDLKSHIAAWVQKELQNAMCKKINYLKNKYDIKNICISGGVAYNCKANGFLFSSIPDVNFYISPFSGDVGQSIGNACYGYYKHYNSIPNIDIKKTYLGVDSSFDIKKINNFYQSNYKEFNPKISKSSNIYSDIAKLLSKGKVGAVQIGCSELGPRALGNRSILASANCKAIRDRVNNIKDRESYMPLAPVMFHEVAEEFFIDKHSPLFELMTTAVKAKKISRKIQGVLHADNTARIQSVSRNEKSAISFILSALESIGEKPILINTSFNPKSKPISHSLEDALTYFYQLDLDFLAFDGLLLTKENVLKSSKKIQEFLFFEKRYLDIPLDFLNRKLLENNKKTYFREYFNLYSIYTDWFLKNNKTTTIRFKKGGIETVNNTVLPLFKNNYLDHKINKKFICNVHISKIVIKDFCSLNSVDAVNDGFSSIEELREALIDIYGSDIINGVVTIYSISPTHEGFKSF